MMKFLVLLVAAAAFASAAAPTQSNVLHPASSEGLPEAKVPAAVHPHERAPQGALHPAVVIGEECGCHQEQECPCAHKVAPAPSCACHEVDPCACKKTYVTPHVTEGHEGDVHPEIVAPKCGEPEDPCHGGNPNEAKVTIVKPSAAPVAVPDHTTVLTSNTAKAPNVTATPDAAKGADGAAPPAGTAPERS